MRTKFSGILTLFLAFVVQITFAQEKTISGTVTDDKGLPLPGVNVVVKNTSNGAQTDFDGNYSINANPGAVLLFSYVGFENKEIVVGNKETINMQLVVSASELEEVVVTALGISRASKELGYAVSTVKSDDLVQARETNLVSALQGKVSGVQITNQSGNVGGSTKILVRGLTRLAGNNNPLWVVDGVPISDANTVTGSRITGGFDFGNRAQDINLDDVENVTVLKGASAAALYGSRAANGVIVVTTKKGKTAKPQITFSNTTRFDNPLRLPDFQNEFAPGDEGVFDVEDDLIENAPFAGWGPRISDNNQTYVNVAGQRVPFQAFPNAAKDFYKTGKTIITNFAIAGTSNNGENDYRLSTSYTDQSGIVPASGLNRYNLGLNAGSKLSETLTSRFSVNYVRTNIFGNVAAGANDPNILTNTINGLPRTTDISLFQPWIDENGDQLNPIDPNFTNNPYWTAFENKAQSTTERFFGNASLEYKPFSSFSILGRAGYDSFNDKRFTSNRKGTIGRLNGTFTDDDINRRELTLDLIATYENTFSEDFDLTLRGGVQWNERIFERIGNNATDLVIPELFDPGNVENNVPFKGFLEQRLFGAFGDLTLTYKGWLSLNVTGRNDWSSTLPEDNNSYFYPSVALSWVFSDALNIQNDFFSYGKIRGNWANVGADTRPYELDFLFAAQQNYFGQFGTGGNFPFDGELSFSGPNVIPNPDLLPENQVSYEAGIELGFFKNRLTLDVTYYDNFTEDQILRITVPQSTGFALAVQNIGEVSNKGLEIELGAKIIKTDNFSWQLDANFTTNDFVIEELVEGTDRFVVASGFGSTQIIAEPGESLGLFGVGYERAQDADGNPIENQILVNDDGLRFDNDNTKRFGNIFPDFTAGLTSTFQWKGFTLSTTFDWREGGVMFSNTTGLLRTSGLAEETLDRETLFVDPNTFTQPGGPGTPAIPNTTPIRSVQDYWRSFAGTTEGNVFDATFIKWRELSLFYSFDSKMLDKTPLSSLRVGVQGRNLAIFNTDVPHVDPETNLFGSGSNGAGIERGSVPSTRSVGFNIQVGF